MGYPLIDSKRTALDAQMNAGLRPQTTGLSYLPEALYYFAQVLPFLPVPKAKPIRILDFGAGRSLLAEAMRSVLTPVLVQTYSNPETKASGISGIMARLLRKDRMLDQMLDAAAPLMRKKYVPSPSRPRPDILDVVRYDPALRGIDRMPPGTFDFVLCLDVLQCVPDKAPRGRYDTLLENVARAVFKKGRSAFLTVSTRQSAHIHQDGSNAHCVVADPNKWYDKLFPCMLDTGMERSLEPVFSRDLTGAAFTLDLPLLPQDHEGAYALTRRFGLIDHLTPSASKPQSPAEKALLSDLQAVKRVVSTRNLTLWCQEEGPHILKIPPVREFIEKNRQAASDQPFQL